ncbi:DDE-type integrase/transposase/recombinase [Bhargavaea ullalensis]
MKDHRKAEEIAANRYQLIAPLLEPGMGLAEAADRRRRIAAENGLSERTLRRYISAYRKEGFAGLKPAARNHPVQQQDWMEKAVDHAVLLRREVPSRSIAQIIQTLEWEGIVKPGSLKRSTLQEKLAERGYSARQMRLYQQTPGAARRFQKRSRNELWHSDIKYGPYLPIGPDGKKKQVYLVAIIDDATRFIVHAAFYPTLEAGSVEKSLRQAIQEYGVPDAFYFDNGKQYRTKWMSRMCSKLGIRLLFARPYSPESKGKVERFNRTVDGFLAEAALEKPKSLEELNRLFAVWLEECYQKKGHSGLPENRSPFEAYQRDRRALSFAAEQAITEAFLHAEARKVDKSGCISFHGKKYEVGLAFIGQTVDVIYDPESTEEIRIEHEGHEPWTAKKLEIGEFAGRRPALPETLQQAPAEESRVLRAAKKRNEERETYRPPAISFKRMKEVPDRV